MSQRRPVRAYALEQARELLAEFGIVLEEMEAGPRQVLTALHSAVRNESLSADQRGLLRAEAMLVATRTTEAEQALRALSARGETLQVRGLAFDRLGDIAWWYQDFSRAAGAYRQALELRPNDVRTQKDLARALWHLGEPSPARRTFGTDVLEVDPAARGHVVPLTTVPGVTEVHGLYVSSDGSGVIELQGCLDSQPGMVATGSLGAMAQEACDLAWALWRRTSAVAGSGVRVHSPHAGVLKEGPSLGLAVYVLFGTVLGRLTPRAGDCFTGEIDLKGRVLAIGGAEKKALAAYLTGFRRMFLPADNLLEVEESFAGILDLQPVAVVDELDGKLT